MASNNVYMYKNRVIIPPLAMQDDTLGIPTGCSANVAPPFNFLCTRSHVKWLKVSLSDRGYIGILYLENLGGRL